MRRLILLFSLILTFFLPVTSWAAWTFVTGCGHNVGVPGTSIACTVATNVAAGDTVFVWHTNETGQSPTSVTDGTSTFTIDPDGVLIANSITSVAYYLLSSTALTTPTYTVNHPSADISRIVVQVWRPSAGATVSFVDSITGTGNGTALTSGNLVTGTEDGLVFGANGHTGVGPDDTSLQINGVAYSQLQKDDGAKTKVWSRTYSTGFTGAATGTNATADNWHVTAMAFKQVAGGAETKYFKRRQLP